MINQHSIKKFILLVLQKLARYTKQQKVFVLYLLVLVFLMFVLPIAKISPADPESPTRLVFLLSGAFGKTTLLIMISVLILLGWNMSFRFKNFITTYFGFKEDESLFNFGILWLISSMYLAINDTIGLFTETTTIQVSLWGYNLTLLVLLGGLILTLISLFKKATLSNKGKIVHIMDDEHNSERKAKAQETVKGLFGE